jgi:hypothetical protein
MTCRACGLDELVFLFSGSLRGRPVDYSECSNCLYVQTQHPDWLPEAYASPINISDTGHITRNLSNCQLTVAVLLWLRQLNGRVLDYAGGHGLLVRLLRDAGVDAFWQDRYTENLFARGFEHDGTTVDLLTAFEAFEHFVDPSAELGRMLAVSPTVLLSTELIPTPAPPQSDWWYYGTDHGQHIGFFRRRTLEVLAEQFGKSLQTDNRSLHVIGEHVPSLLVWTALARARRLIAMALRPALKSKTWSDYLLLSGR